MKKLLCILLSLACILGLCACAKTVDDVTTEEILKKNELETVLKQYDNMQYVYTQYDGDDNVKTKSTYFYMYDNYGYLYFNALIKNYGIQELNTYHTVTNGALYTALSGMTELSVFPKGVKDAEDYIATTIDHFNLDFEDVVKDNGEYYLIKAKKITETYYMYLKHECTYYFDRETYVLKKIDLKATDRDGDLTYRSEIVFEYNVEAPTDTADKYFIRPGEEDAVTTVDIVYPLLENSQKQTFQALESTLIRGASVDGVEYTVYKDENLETKLTALNEREDGATTVYIAPTPEEESSMASVTE